MLGLCAACKKLELCKDRKRRSDMVVDMRDMERENAELARNGARGKGLFHSM